MFKGESKSYPKVSVWTRDHEFMVEDVWLKRCLVHVEILPYQLFLMCIDGCISCPRGISAGEKKKRKEPDLV